jgi:hypothetical protein
LKLENFLAIYTKLPTSEITAFKKCIQELTYYWKQINLTKRFLIMNMIDGPSNLLKEIEIFGGRCQYLFSKPLKTGIDSNIFWG